MDQPKNTQLATQPQDQAIDLFTAGGFDLTCRIARAFSTSDAVPAQFRALVEKKGRNGSTWVENPAALGNCIVAIETARAVGMSITSVMQQANNIEGKLTWSAQFIIGAINASRRFTPLQFEFTPRGRIKATYREKQDWNDAKHRFDYIERTVEIDDVQCYAWAYAMESGRVTSRKVTGPPVSMKMAVEEGWYAKSGSKWQGEMAQLMMTYRAGSFFGRIHAPDIVMGMGQTAEEVRDTIELEPDPVVAPAPPATDPPRKPPKDVQQREEPERDTGAAGHAEPPGADEPPRKEPAGEPGQFVKAAQKAVAEAAAAEAEAEAIRRTADKIEKVLDADLADPFVDAMNRAEAAQNGAPNTPAPATEGTADKPRGPATPETAQGQTELASAGQKQNIRVKVQQAGYVLGDVLRRFSMPDLDPVTLDGMTVAQWRRLKEALTS